MTVAAEARQRARVALRQWITRPNHLTAQAFIDAIQTVAVTERHLRR